MWQKVKSQNAEIKQNMFITKMSDTNMVVTKMNVS